MYVFLNANINGAFRSKLIEITYKIHGMELLETDGRALTKNIRSRACLRST